MRLAISNIAWDVDEDEDVARLLRRYDMDAIDIAPGKYFPTPSTATADDIARVRNWWSQRGIAITGMQALLFGTTGLNIFGSAEVQAALIDRLDSVCRVAASLGATRLVFGSPKNRDRSGIADSDVVPIAQAFFQQLGERAQSHGVLICLEPNPTVYGANFMVTTDDTASVVRAVAHPAIKMQLDTGAIVLNDESAQEVVEKYASIVGHIHVSEPQLLPLGDAKTPHKEIAKTIARFLPHHLVCIEMLATKDEPHVEAIERAITVATEAYA